MNKLRYELRQVDSWNDGEGWYWNDSYSLGEYSVTNGADEKKAFLRALKKHGIKCKRGACVVNWDGDVWTLAERKTGAELFAAVPCI